jgi:two-component SAPR family response regulator
MAEESYSTALQDSRQRTGRVFSQDQLIEPLFANLPMNRATDNFHNRISAVRKTLEPDRLRGVDSMFIQSPYQVNYAFSPDSP